jgi:hypothetical protein
MFAIFLCFCSLCSHLLKEVNVGLPKASHSVIYLDVVNVGSTTADQLLYQTKSTKKQAEPRTRPEEAECCGKRCLLLLMNSSLNG